ncbi:MAG: hypothetical protein P1U39_05390 [Legionellaceae bacterium]|nr:hypothetical protein [Legionellaceae bacterium]
MTLTRVLDVPVNRERKQADAALIAEINAKLFDINQAIAQYDHVNDAYDQSTRLFSLEEEIHALLERIQALQLGPSQAYILQHVQAVHRFLSQEIESDFQVLISGNDLTGGVRTTPSEWHVEPLPELSLELDRFVLNKKGAQTLQTNVNNAVRAINYYIDLYQHEGVSDKSKTLAVINRKMNTLIHTTSNSSNPVLKGKVRAFRKHLKNIFSETQAKQEILEAKSPTTLAAFIRNMSQPEVHIFTEILMRTNNTVQLKNKLKSFYPAHHASKKAFDAYLDTHHIEMLHTGNSKNFTVHKLGTTETKVLKVEYLSRRGNAAEVKLRDCDALAGVFTLHSVQKKAVYYHPKLQKKVSGNLVVTEFCTGNNVEVHGQDFKDDDEARLKGAADIFTQMSDIIIHIEAAGCAFPDMKATNWLVDSSGKLRVADGKSFMFTDASGNINEGGMCTQFMSAPEQLGHDWFGISADKMHAYLLAKNLYHYLVRGDENYLYDGEHLKLDASEFDFSLPIFKTSTGQAYQALIERTMKIHPEDRLSVGAFQESISAIHATYQQAETAQASIQTSQDYKKRVLETRQEGKPDVGPRGDETFKP